MSLLGRIITPTLIENALKSQIQEWIDFCLAQTELQAGLAAGKYKRPRSYHLTNKFRLEAEFQQPAIVIASGGFADRPAVKGDGGMDARFQIAVAAVVSAKDAESTRMMGHVYFVALALAVLWNQDLGLDGVVKGITLVDYDTKQLDAQDERSLFAANLLFDVDVRNLFNVRKGLSEVPAEPHEPVGDNPIVPDIEHIVIQTEQEPLDG